MKGLQLVKLIYISNFKYLYEIFKNIFFESTFSVVPQRRPDWVCTSSLREATRPPSTRGEPSCSSPGSAGKVKMGMDEIERGGAEEYQIRMGGGGAMYEGPTSAASSALLLPCCKIRFRWRRSDGAVNPSGETILPLGLPKSPDLIEFLI